MRKGDADSLIHVDGIITMPIHREQLYHCILGETEIADVESLHKESDISKAADSDHKMDRRPLSLGEGGKVRQQGLCPSVLIVEDNLINQKVAVGLFETLGCQVYVAECGDQALSLVQDYHIDVVMMDWELPGMDGFEVAQAIRELEQANCLKRTEPAFPTPKDQDPTSCFHLPIVGMTAHGHASRNPSRWAHVMDDCLAKPIHLQDLASVLERWVGVSRQSGSQQEVLGQTAGEGCLVQDDTVAHPGNSRAQSEQQVNEDCYNYSAALDRMEGNKELLHSLFEIFFETWPGLAHGMREAMVMEDRQGLQRYAHQAKGALFALHASHQAVLAEHLEEQSVQLSFSNIAPIFQRMEEEVEALMLLLRERLHAQGEKPVLGPGTVKEKA